MAPKQRRRGGAVAPAGYDLAAYPTFAVTVDIVILSVADGELRALLIQRMADPYEGAWALPGGFKQPDETLDQAARRELREETGVAAPGHLAQLGAYGDPGRDPRTNVVTVAYLAVAPTVGSLTAGTDAAAARLWPVDQLLDGTVTLAFDHERILRDAIERTARELEQTGLAPAFLSDTFTLSELQSVYEAVWGDDLDPANFRRSVHDGGDEPYVEPTGERAPAGPKGGRPPKLFRSGPAWQAGSPLRRSHRRR
jgi:8-oxo-dGTP diphosphatase